MTDSAVFISDQPLPEALDVEALKSRGIKQLQAMVGTVWTNYNESDPGVTILDQLCYALTELGYCAQFPIEDILTGHNGAIQYRDQFFMPQEILTCSPVTLDDYRRLVIDAVPEVRVIEIEPHVSDGKSAFTGRYNTYLSIKDAGDDYTAVNNIIERVFVLLNQHRNLGEVFNKPIMFVPQKIELGGKIVLMQTADVGKIYAQIQETLLNYAQPLAIQSGYGELLAKGITPDRIFNGPELKHGWIAGQDALKGKCSNVSLCSLTALIAGIDGVLAVESLYFLTENGGSENIPVEKENIPEIMLSHEFLSFYLNGALVDCQAQQRQTGHLLLAALSTKHQAAGLPSSIDLYPDLPKGTYRNIEEYYSVQNTFPDIYGIGYNSIQSDAPSYRVARSRQLKGYLMSFDQLLANEFSQLAHVGELFSFRSNHRGSGQADIPYEKFVTTYYCQPLYDIPDVKPLLLGNEAFHYQYDPDKTEKEVEKKAWKEFRKFQFNEYIHGLRQIMESDEEAMDRRDAMLSHLMARHGDDANQYDEMIRTCQWFGSELKTSIIVKNIWLQNYQLLSYNRSRAFNLFSGTKLPLPGDSSIVESLEVKSGNGRAWWREPIYPVFDGEVDQSRIYAEARLKLSDFDRFSAFELKAGILLGLPARWRALANKLQTLLNDSGFCTWIGDPQPSCFSLPDSDLLVKRCNDMDQLCEGDNEYVLMDIRRTSHLPNLADYQAHLDQLLWLATQTKGFLLVESIRPPSMSDDWQKSGSSHDGLEAGLKFPGYVTFVQQPKFGLFIEKLMQYQWPAHVKMDYSFESFDEMWRQIGAYVLQHNELSCLSKDVTK